MISQVRHFGKLFWREYLCREFLFLCTQILTYFLEFVFVKFQRNLMTSFSRVANIYCHCEWGVTRVFRMGIKLFKNFCHQFFQKIPWRRNLFILIKACFQIRNTPSSCLKKNNSCFAVNALIEFL